MLFPDSHILSQALQAEVSPASEASHFALMQRGRLRYLIALRGGASRLASTLTPYSSKIRLLKVLLRIAPLRLLAKLGLGCFVRARLHPSLEEMLPEGCRWNMLVGTYWAKQKLVLQCFRPGEELCSFLKVGNEACATDMETEISFLEAPHHFKTLKLPELLGARRAGEGCPFRLMLTREFRGEKVDPAMTAEIYALYKELASNTKGEHGQTLALSHGDFAPWNMRRVRGGFILFDWEAAAYRPVG